MIAIVILTLWVFGIYKLINNNTYLFAQNQTLTTLNFLLESQKECMKHLGYSKFIDYEENTGFSINFWADHTWCKQWSYDDGLTFSWVKIDGNTYYLRGKIAFNSGSEIKIEYSIFSLSTWLYPNIPATLILKE